MVTVHNCKVGTIGKHINGGLSILLFSFPFMEKNKYTKTEIRHYINILSTLGHKLSGRIVLRNQQFSFQLWIVLYCTVIIIFTCAFYFTIYSRNGSRTVIYDGDGYGVSWEDWESSDIGESTWAHDKVSTEYSPTSTSDSHSLILNNYSRTNKPRLLWIHSNAKLQA